MGDEFGVKAAEEVAFRTLALMAVCLRATAEQVLQRGPDPAWEAKLAELRNWAEDQGVSGHFSDSEREVMGRPIGSIDAEEQFHLSWRLQAVVATLWAAGQLDPMPTYARSATAKLVQPLVPLCRPIADFLASARLLPEERLLEERRRTQFWNWRARCDLFRRRGQQPPAGETYEATIAEAARSALEDGLVDAVDDGDVACDDRPYRDLDDQEFADAASTAAERLHALNWVCGDSEDWDDVSTDT